MPEPKNTENNQSIEMHDTVSNVNPAESASGKSNSKKPFIIAVIFAVSMIILGIGAAAYTSVVLNNPDRIWEQALQNTSDGFTEVSQKIEQSSAKGGTIDGNFEISAPLTANGTIDGVWYEENAKINGNVNISGIETGGEIRIIAEPGTYKSNTYIKLEGLDKASTFLSLVQPELVDIASAVNGNWYVIDDAIKQDISSDLDEKVNSTDISPEELAEISTNVATLLNERLFTTDETKAVFIVNEALGREDFEGDDSYKYSVKVQKQQFADFIDNFKDTLEQAEMQDVFMQNLSGEEEANFSDILNQIDKIDFATLQAEVWVDMENKYFRNVRIPFNDENERLNGYIDFGLDYEGGDELPFSMRFVSKENNVDSIDALFEASLNKETSVLGLGFTIVATQDGSQINLTSNLTLKPSDEIVEVEVPENAQNISSMLSLFMGQDAFMPAFEGFETDDSIYQLDDIEL